MPTYLLLLDVAYNANPLFSGDRYWVYNANHLSAGFPSEGRPLTDFSIPADVPRIDAAFIWGYNKRTYLVSGDMYWKMNENNTFVEYDYPRDMRTWKNVPVPLDAAFNDYHGEFIHLVPVWQTCSKYVTSLVLLHQYLSHEFVRRDLSLFLD